MRKPSKRTIEAIVDTIVFGMEWIKYGEADDSHKKAEVQTIGRIAARQISQWITHDCEPLVDVIEALKLHDVEIRRHIIKMRLLEYLNQPSTTN